MPTINEDAVLMTDKTTVPNPAELVEKKVSVHSLLLSLPTPSRSRLAPQPGEMRSHSDVADERSPGCGGQVPATLGQRRAVVEREAGTLGIMASVGPMTQTRSRGPEPWSLPDAATQEPAQQNNYREWLQSRGRQTLQVTLQRGNAVPMPSVPSVKAEPAVSAIGAGMLCGISASLNAFRTQPVEEVASWNMRRMTQHCGTQASLEVQQALISNGRQMPIVPSSTLHMSMLPQGGQQVLMMPQVKEQGPVPQYQQMVPNSVLHTLLLPESGLQPGPLAPMVAMGAQTPAPAQPLGTSQEQASLVTTSQQQDSMRSTGCGPLSQGELMAMLMPDALSMNCRQIAEQLQAASRCEYED